MDNPLTATPLIPNRQLHLPDGAVLTITRTVPASAADRRAAVRGSQLYLIAGWLDRPGGHLAGYLGKSSVLHGTRAARSYLRWVRDQARIHPFALALVHRETPYLPDALSFTESRCVQLLSAPGNYAMLNTHSSANIAANRLQRPDIIASQTLADTLITHIERHVYLDQHNPPDVYLYASNMREAAARIVLTSPRALDTFEVVQRLNAAGHTSTAQRPDYCTRRDLNQRETSRGTPRIFSTTRRGRRLFWGPHLPKREALALYDQAHPIR